MSNKDTISKFRELIDEDKNRLSRKFDVNKNPDVFSPHSYEAATARLLPIIEKMFSVIKFYANENSWDEMWVEGDGIEDDGGDCSCKIDWDDIEIKKANDGTIYYACGGKKAREFISELKTLRVFGGDK